MKIPYFYLKAGSVEIFQPCNVAKNSSALCIIHSVNNEGDQIEIIESSHPEIRKDKLFLNGTDKHMSFKILKINYPTHFQELLNLLRKHNGESNV